MCFKQYGFVFHTENDASNKERIAIFDMTVSYLAMDDDLICYLSDGTILVVN
jgi:hypothetical protein